ncbi:MAG: 5'-deoxyadenosine deaminase [Vicinamibacterales bacterium]
MSLLIRDATIVTMNDGLEVVRGDVAIRNGRIESVGASADERFDRVIDAAGDYLLPGLIQTHIHLCQTLFRSYADDMPLMQWLRTRVWPMEAAHTASTLTAAARLATTELLMSGTTAILSMETVHDTDAVCEAVAASGIRATVGKCMMDADADVPARLKEGTQSSINESQALRTRWHGTANDRLRVAFAPRFAVSCTRDLLEAVAALSADLGALVHTHASEAREEVDIVRALSGGLSNLEYLNAVHLATPRLCAAHCVWADEHDQTMLADHDVKVMHCPSSNLKLGSGIAPVVEMRKRGITVSLGADGAACNNRLDMFEEMRLAAMLQSVRLVPGALTARDALWMATRAGARTLGLESEIGSIETGKKADMILVSRRRPHLAPDADPFSTLVYAARGSDVRTTIVDGEILVENGMSTRVSMEEVASEAVVAARLLAARAGV